MLTSLAPTHVSFHYDGIHSSMRPLLVCKLPFEQWETWLPPSTTHLLSCSNPEYMYSNIRNVNISPFGKHCVQFILPLVLTIYKLI